VLELPVSNRAAVGRHVVHSAGVSLRHRLVALAPLVDVVAREILMDGSSAAYAAVEPYIRTLVKVVATDR
jgi:hypothetical protein